MSRLLWLAVSAVFAITVLTFSSVDAYAAQARVSVDTQGEVAPQREDAIRVRLDKSTLVELEQDANSIIIGNPGHVDVFLETSRLLVIVPVQEGMTTLTVLDSDSNIILEKKIIVISNQDENFVRIRRICRSGSDGCAAKSVYYCPPGEVCHGIALYRAEDIQVPVDSPGAAGPVSSGDDEDEDGDDEENNDDE